MVKAMKEKRTIEQRKIGEEIYRGMGADGQTNERKEKRLINKFEKNLTKNWGRTSSNQ